MLSKKIAFSSDMLPSENDIVEYFARFDLRKSDSAYLHSHLRRYIFLLQILREIVGSYEHQAEELVSILDVGPSFQTLLIEQYIPNIRINSVGNTFSSTFNPSIKIVPYDLNYSFDRSTWPDIQRHDIVILAEVMEYLFVPPEHLIDLIGHYLKPGGYLIVQVSNGISFSKRLDFLRGIKTGGSIGDGNKPASHIREFTSADLIRLGQKKQLKVSDVFLKNYYCNESAMYKFMKLFFQFNPQFNEAITIVYQK